VASHLFGHHQRTLGVVNHRPLLPPQQASGEQGQHAVIGNGLAIFIHEGHPVTVPVIGDAQGSPLFDHSLADSLNVFRQCRVR
jgi:hypothetical protein